MPHDVDIIDPETWFDRILGNILFTGLSIAVGAVVWLVLSVTRVAHASSFSIAAGIFSLVVVLGLVVIHRYRLSTNELYVNAQIKDIGDLPYIIVNEERVLSVWVGDQLKDTPISISKKFLLDLVARSQPYKFIVSLDGDPDIWDIQERSSTLVVTGTGTTRQHAEFHISALCAGIDKLHIMIERAQTHAIIQHLWLSVESRAADSLDENIITPEPYERYSTTGVSLSNLSIAQRTVYLIFTDGRVEVIADLPDGRVRDVFEFAISVNELQSATKRLRLELERIVMYKVDGDYPFSNLYNLDVDENTARKAFVDLADAAEQVWERLFRNSHSANGLRYFIERMRDSLPQGSSIQIVLQNPEVILPWALLYDKPGHIDEHTLDWNGFWGYRYIIDIIPPGRYPDPELKSRKTNTMVLLSDHNNLHHLCKEQVDFILNKASELDVSIHWGHQEVLLSLKNDNLAQFIYCYCHGERESGAKKLESLASESSISFSTGQKLRIADLRRIWREPFRERPLVFLNACEGAAQEPFYYDGFMPFFMEEQMARGFIGTEVKAPALLAQDFALCFMQELTKGRPVGEILWQLRRHYLDKYHTILGFNYTLYGFHEMVVNRNI